MTHRNLFRWAFAAAAVLPVLAGLVLGGCAAGAAATATPTRTPRPAATAVPPTAVAQALAVAMPTEIPPTATATKVPPTATATATLAPTEAPSATPTRLPPTATPRPAAPPPTAAPVRVQPTAPPPPPAAADPCAGIGGDGCKWHVTGGPSFGQNGGMELKLQFIFIHSGVAGGQPQGSYFVVLEKDGQKLPISDAVRSIAKTSNQGPLGKYNYEYSLGVDKLPGKTVAGHYRLWVLDGNGERDSQNLEFDLPANSGLIWIQFDQA